MKKLALVFAVGAAALFGGSAANAADTTVKAKAATDVSQPSTDISAQRRHRHYGHRHHGYRHYGHRHYRPYYGNSYGYAPRPYYGGYHRGYGYGGPGITFGFGGRGW
jgi:hypothetical protein